jgi:hypothetical protein
MFSCGFLCCASVAIFYTFSTKYTNVIFMLVAQKNYDYFHKSEIIMIALLLYLYL